VPACVGMGCILSGNIPEPWRWPVCLERHDWGTPSCHNESDWVCFIAALKRRWTVTMIILIRKPVPGGT
jgi:hypothetical protein